MTAGELTLVEGRKSYLGLVSEDVWDRNPFDASGSGESGAQDWVILPVDSYTAKFVPQRRNADPFTGLRQRKHGRFFRGNVQGQLTTKLYGYYHNPTIGSLAQYALEWGFADHESLTPRSKSAIWFEGPGIADKEHSGLKVNSATLSGSSDGGSIDLSLDLLGGQEVGNSAVHSSPQPPNNYHKLSDFEFHRATLSINGTTVYPENFQWSVQNNYQAKWGNQYTPRVIYPGARIETFSFQLLKDSDTYDGYRRSESRTQLSNVVLTLIGNHDGTASNTYTRVAITFPLLEYAGHEDVMGQGQIFEQPIQFEVMKPDTSSNGSSMSWDTTS